MEPFVTEPMLPTSFPPRPWESVRSYVIRLAEANGYRDAASFQQAVGMNTRLIAFAAPPQWDLLAKATGLPVAAFSGMRRLKLPPAHDGRLVSFLGHVISPVYLNKLTHGICPQCLVEDGYGRDSWSLHYVLACPCHRVFLVDVCHECRQPLGLHHWATMTGCACGGDLTRSPTAHADDRVVAAVAALVHIAEACGAGAAADARSIRPLPEQVLSFTLNEALDCCHVLGTVALAKLSRERPPARRDGSVRTHLLNRREIHQNPFLERLEILTAAAFVLADWPTNFWRMLDGLRGRLLDPKASDPMSRDFGAVYKALYALAIEGRSGRPLPLVWQALDSYRSRNYPSRSRVTIVSFDPTVSKLSKYLNVSSLSKDRGLSYGVATRIHRRVLERIKREMHDAPDKILVAEFKRRFEDLGERFKNSISQKQMRSLLVGEDVTLLYADWHTPDLLYLDPETQGLQFSIRYDKPRVLQLLARLRQNAQRVASCSRLMRVASLDFMVRLPPSYGRPELLRDMLAGRLPYYSAVTEPKYADFHVDPVEAFAYLWKRHTLTKTLAAQFVTRREAEEMFAAAFGSNTQFPLSLSKELRRTGRVRWTLHGGKPLHNLGDLLGWADAHLAAPGQSIAAFLEDAGISVIGGVRHHNQPFQVNRIRAPIRLDPKA